MTTAAPAAGSAQGPQNAMSTGDPGETGAVAVIGLSFATRCAEWQARAANWAAALERLVDDMAPPATGTRP